MTETRVLKTVAFLFSAVFILAVWLDTDETTDTAVLKTLFALVMLLLVSWGANGWRLSNEQVAKCRQAEQERTDALIAETNETITRLKEAGQ